MSILELSGSTLTNVNRYFGAEFASAAMLILGKCRVIQYYPTLIALDFIGIFADSTLLSFLLITFANRLYENVGKNDSGTITIFTFYCWVLGLIALANPPSFLWKGVMNMIGADGEAAFRESGGVKLKILSSYTALNVSFYGVYFGGVLGLAWVSFRFMRKFRKGAKTLKTLLLIVVISLVLRTIGKFLYSILFVLQARTKSPQMVLIHTIFYGLLSVIIYGSIMVMLRTEGFQKGVQIRRENGVSYQRASQSSLHEDVYKPPKHVNVHTSEIVDVPMPGPQPWRGHAADYYDYRARAH